MKSKEQNGHKDGMSVEDQKLEEFKSRVVDLLKTEHDDFALKKWLKARCYDVSKSEKMFRDSMAFRERMGCDRLLEDYTPPKVLQEYLTGGLCGFDKEGSPVRVERYGCLDMKGIMCSSKKSDLIKTKLQQNELLVKQWGEQTKRLGRRVDGLTVIFDMEHSGTKQLWRPGLHMYMELVKNLEDNYPEVLKRLMVVNAPRIFPILWKIGRPLISEDMRKKIFVLGSDHIEGLKKFIDTDSIPAYLGGTLTDPDGDPMCRTMICHGGTVPPSYYLTECGDTEGTEVTTLEKGQKLKLDFDVLSPGSILRWEFRTEDYDIGFGLVHLGSNGKEQELINVKRVNAHQLAQDGSYVCEQIGTYAIIFDNHYSWSRPKTLHYLVELHHNDEDLGSEVDQMSTGGSWTRLVKGMQITHL